MNDPTAAPAHEDAPIPATEPAVSWLSAAIPADGPGLARTRRTVRDWLAARGVTEEADSAVLLLNELITNVRQHAPGPARVGLILTSGLLRCAVRDSHPARPVLVRPGVDDEEGRGLQLVAAIALRWGSIPVSDGKLVWFDLPVTATSRATADFEILEGGWSPGTVTSSGMN